MPSCWVSKGWFEERLIVPNSYSIHPSKRARQFAEPGVMHQSMDALVGVCELYALKKYLRVVVAIVFANVG